MEKIKQYFSDLKNDIITNNQKLKIYLILYYLIPCIAAGILVSSDPLLINDFILSFLFIFIINTIAIIIFLPTYLVLYSLFKKIQGKWARGIITAAAVPLTMFVYFLIILPFLLLKNVFLDSISWILLTIFFISGLAWLYEMLPVAFIVTLFTPKKILNEKYYNLLTIFLMEIIGIVLFIVTMFIGETTGLFN